ncbi:MAG: hypothetical protein AVDCRST_MAG89-1341, partial [uncultured Gemmatimonadetes bacterium]
RPHRRGLRDAGPARARHLGRHRAVGPAVAHRRQPRHPPFHHARAGAGRPRARRRGAGGRRVHALLHPRARGRRPDRQPPDGPERHRPRPRPRPGPRPHAPRRAPRAGGALHHRRRAHRRLRRHPPPGVGPLGVRRALYRPV